jgi:hypothetical protein
MPAGGLSGGCVLEFAARQTRVVGSADQCQCVGGPQQSVDGRAMHLLGAQRALPVSGLGRATGLGGKAAA